MTATEKAQPVEQLASTTDYPDWRWAESKSLKVKPAFHSLIPLQSKDEYKALEQSIQVEGCHDPLLVWKDHNVVLDGHTRRALSIQHKKPVKVREVELPDEKAAIVYILQIQRQRRNLTRETLSYFRGAEYNAVKQQHVGKRPGRTAKGQSDPLPAIRPEISGQSRTECSRVRKPRMLRASGTSTNITNPRRTHLTCVGEPEVACRRHGCTSCFAERVPHRLTRQPPWGERSGSDRPGSQMPLERNASMRRAVKRP